MDLRRVVDFFFFSLFRFLFVVRMEWYFTSSLHVELAIEVSINNLCLLVIFTTRVKVSLESKLFNLQRWNFEPAF